jgi:checkpoint serine/threonine-protein kinase
MPTNPVVGLTLIDFGRSLDRHSFAPSTQFLADWPPDKHDCPAVRNARPWTVQPDYWGAAGVIHLLLFGKWLEVSPANEVSSPTEGGSANEESCSSEATEASSCSEANPSPPTFLPFHTNAQPLPLPSSRRYKPKESFKRYWAVDQWSAVFGVLLNPVVNPTSDAARQTSQLRDVLSQLEAYLEQHAERKGLKGALRRIEERIQRQNGRRA